MNNHYLLLLRKDDIIDLYKYGRWNVLCPSIKFDGNIEELSINDKLVTKLFKQANPFAYSIEYYLVHMISPKSTFFEVDDILDIIALDRNSFRIGLSLSPEIKLSEPIFEKYYIDFQVSNEIFDSKKGIDNIFSLFGLKKPSSLLKKSELEKIIRDSYLESPVEGDNSIWYYLLRYSRHHPYPKDNRGFFLDSIHAFLNYEKKKEMDVSITKSRIGKIIVEQDLHVHYSDLLFQIEIQNEFRKRSEKAHKGYYRIAPLFLMLKETFSEGVHENKKYCNMDLSTFINVMKNKYDNDILSKALYLLGIVLGREKTYQYIYKKNKLPILK